MGNKEMSLLKAAEVGDAELVQRILSEGGAVNERDGSSRTVLMIAASRGHDRIVQILLDAGADLNAENWRGDTAIMWAAARGHLNVVKLLLSAKANLVGIVGGMPVYVGSIARNAGHLEIAQLIDGSSS